MAGLIRSRLEKPKPRKSQPKAQSDPLMRVAGICSGPVVSDSIDEDFYGI